MLNREMRRKKSFVIVFFVILCRISAYAQDRYTEMINSSMDFLERFSEETEKNAIAPEPKYVLENYFTNEIPYYIQLQQEIVDAQKMLETRENGIKLKSTVNQNFSNALDANEEDVFYKTRVRAGVEWSVLNQGLGDARLKSKILSNQQQINELTKVKTSRQNAYGFWYNTIIYHYNNYKLDLLRQRGLLLDEYLKIISKLYLLHNVKFNDVSLVKTNLQITNELSGAYYNYNQSFEKVFPETWKAKARNLPDLPVWDVSLDSLSSFLRPENVFAQIVDLETRNLALNQRLQRQYDLRINAYWNVTFKTYGKVPQQYPNVGASFSVPLFTRNKEEEKIQKLNTLMLTDRYNDEMLQGGKEVMNQYLEYKYKYRQYLDFMQKKAGALEEIRKSRINISQVSAMDYTAFKSMDDVYAIMLEMIDIRQQLTLILLKIHSLIPDEGIKLVLTKPKNTVHSVDYSVVMRINSDFISQQDFYIEYLAKNRVGSVVIFGNPGKILLTKLAQKGINVALVVDNQNDINLYTANKQLLLSKLPNIQETVNALAYKDAVELFEVIAAKAGSNLLVFDLQTIVELELQQLYNR